MNKLLPALAAGVLLAACKPASTSSGSAVFERFTYEGKDAVYAAHPLPGVDAAYNPILPGWYSDPSICTNGEGDYFLVTSTFSYFPGVPIFHSRDLVNWRQIGHVLDRPSQLNLARQRTSGGIYAPDIKYNPKNRTYYMITTNVGTGNFLVKTQDPFGPWSEPILLPQVQGIDPSLLFDDDGRAYIVNNDDAPGGRPEYDGHRTIRIVEYDVCSSNLSTTATAPSASWSTTWRTTAPSANGKSLSTKASILRRNPSGSRDRTCTRSTASIT